MTYRILVKESPNICGSPHLWYDAGHYAKQPWSGTTELFVREKRLFAPLKTTSIPKRAPGLYPLQPVPAEGCLLCTVYNRNPISRLSDGFYSGQITFRLSFTHFQSSYPMKNMLALASVFTVFMAVLLVWMDRALANHLEKRALHEMETTMPRPENNLPEIELPEISIRARQGKAASRQLPEVVITARRCTGA
jgi:hypothetical protein